MTLMIDHVIGQQSENIDVYQAIASEVVESSLNGINGIVKQLY